MMKKIKVSSFGACTLVCIPLPDGGTLNLTDNGPHSSAFIRNALNALHPGICETPGASIESETAPLAEKGPPTLENGGTSYATRELSKQPKPLVTVDVEGGKIVRTHVNFARKLPRGSALIVMDTVGSRGDGASLDPVLDKDENLDYVMILDQGKNYSRFPSVLVCAPVDMAASAFTKPKSMHEELEEKKRLPCPGCGGRDGNHEKRFAEPQVQAWYESVGCDPSRLEIPVPIGAPYTATPSITFTREAVLKADGGAGVKCVMDSGHLEPSLLDRHDTWPFISPPPRGTTDERLGQQGQRVSALESKQPPKSMHEELEEKKRYFPSAMGIMCCHGVVGSCPICTPKPKSAEGLARELADAEQWNYEHGPHTPWRSGQWRPIEIPPLIEQYVAAKAREGK